MALSTIDTSSISGLGYGFKNRIINGGMVVDQRGTASTPVTFNNNFPYSVDRWQTAQNAAATQTLTAQQSSVVPNGNFTKSLLITTTTGASVGGTNYANFWQKIEGFNIADLGWGTANAQPVTVSFWARSSLTGNFGFFVGNGAGTRTYMTAINIVAANTWQFFTVTIAGDTSGSWSTTNTTGAYVGFDAGTSSSGCISASTSWQSSGAQGLTGGVQLSATTGATFYITGVQLEAGTVATSFDWRPYGTELALCQRYYYQVNSTATQYATLGSAYARTTTIATAGGISLPVTMRAIPTLTATNTAGAFGVSIGGSDFAGPTVSLAGQVSASAVAFLLTLGSGTMTVGQGGQMYITNNAAYFVGLSSEL